MSVKSHYSAAELATMKLPGLPETERGIRMAAERESWASRPKAKGKGNEYALTSLPDAAQTHIRTAAARELLAKLPVPAAATKAKVPVLREEQLPLALTTEQQTVEAARLGVLAHIENLMAGCGLGKERAMHHLLASVAAGTADPLVCSHAAQGRGQARSQGE